MLFSCMIRTVMLWSADLKALAMNDGRAKVGIVVSPDNTMLYKFLERSTSHFLIESYVVV